MKAIRVHHFGGPEVLQLETLDPPAITTATQVLVEIRAAGVNPVDTYIRSGSYARLPELPYTPGIDGAGVVVAGGADVTQVKVGDRVYGGWPLTGTYAQYALYESAWVYPLPDPLTVEQGACIFVPYSTAHRALFHGAQVQAGETILIHGATGAVGLAAVQLAVAAGLRVIGTGGSEVGRALVAQQGADLVLDHHSDTYRTELMAATAGQGVHCIIEMLANVNLGYDLTLLAPGGRVVVVGSRGTVTVNPRELISRESFVTGVNLFNASPDTLQHTQQALGKGFRSGALRPIVHQVLPLEAAAQVHGQVLARGGLGNRVLVP
ncbi:MAG TPA: NADPH:quinone reductase [Leptolyngbyaceae cyanobacterium M65_K2018_010]|nr:NADPH:quinone reductase [Leptolyngbyaceae cyanobacterium M65_K2018_010]